MPSDASGNVAAIGKFPASFSGRERLRMWKAIRPPTTDPNIMKRMHVNLRVKNLGEAVKFYSELFDSKPTVEKTDYAKWMVEDPRLNFSLSQKSGRVGIEHLGMGTGFDCSVERGQEIFA